MRKPFGAMVALILLAVLVPGRAGATVTVHPFTFSAPVVLPQSGSTGSTSATCYNPCGEPSLVVSPLDGTLWVSTPRTLLICCNNKSSPVWKSTDDGTTWAKPIFPAATGSPSYADAFTGGDTELAVDKRGTVYEGELWLGSDSIYISSDGGQHWDWSPASHDPASDREWFLYSPMEDALYGWYDGFKGLEVVKADLANSPIGARFFPQTTFATVPGGVSPGRPAIDPTDGTLYFPYPDGPSGVAVAISGDGGLSFTTTHVTGSGPGGTGNDFPVMATDSAGNVYTAWSEDKGNGFTLYLSHSSDKGATWSAPVAVSRGISGTAIFPNVMAGAAGRVAVSWFGTSTVGDPNNVPGAIWDVDVSSTLDALDAAPTFTPAVAQSSFHTGNICTNGTGCSGDDRKLLDFFDMQVAHDTGALMVVYARDRGTGTEIAFARQSDGCSLTQPGVYLGPGVPAPDGTPLTVC
ncbi:MAG: sialidase family protein [Actinomycetota bacterium]